MFNPHPIFFCFDTMLVQFHSRFEKQYRKQGDILLLWHTLVTSGEVHFRLRKGQSWLTDFAIAATRSFDRHCNTPCRHGVSTQRQFEDLWYILYRITAKKTTMLRNTGPFFRKVQQWPVNSSQTRTLIRKAFPQHSVIIVNASSHVDLVASNLLPTLWVFCILFYSHSRPTGWLILRQQRSWVNVCSILFFVNLVNHAN